MATLSSDGIVLDCKFTDLTVLDSANITEQDLKIMLDVVPTVESWVLEALIGRIAHHKKKMLQEHRVTYFADANVNTDDEIIAAVFGADGYKTRAERDAANGG
jgi:chemotaxis regulatin CheY-phosphate phosphatase CheZ